MKKAILGFVGVLCAATLTFAAAGLPQATKKAESKAFVGEIWDSPCAIKADHESMAGMVGVDGKDHKECTLKCVEVGAKFVLLVDAAKKVSYELDDQKTPKDFAGEKVKVTGTLNGKILHVEKIEAAK